MPVTGTPGDDTLSFDANSMSGPIDLEAGNDTLNVGWMGYLPINVTTGSGSDTIVFTAAVQNLTTWLNISDFTPGAGGDMINIMPFLDPYLSQLNTGWVSGSDPFYTGYLELVQSGSTVELWVNPDGAVSPSSYPIAKFLNTQLADFTSANFDGLNPTQVSPSVTHVITADLTIPVGETITIHNPNIYRVDQGEADRPGFVYYDQGAGNSVFVNHGTVDLSLGPDIPVGQYPGVLVGFTVSRYSGVGSGASFHNASDGSFVVDNEWVDSSGALNSGASAYGYYAPQQTMPFINDGDFEVHAASGTAYGHYSSEDSPFSNSGTFTVTSGYDAYGIWGQRDSSFTNTGTIYVHGSDFAAGIFYDDFVSPTFTNAGTITVTTDPSSPYASIGVAISEGGNGSTPYDFYNSGTITADVAFEIVYATTNILYSDNFHNSGTVNGTISLAFGDDAVDNKGLISNQAPM